MLKIKILHHKLLKVISRIYLTTIGYYIDKKYRKDFNYFVKEKGYKPYYTFLNGEFIAIVELNKEDYDIQMNKLKNSQ